MAWAGVVFTAGWLLRCVASFHEDNVNLYIAQTVFVYAGPPIYAAAEYNILGRLMYYLPMHAPMNPGFTVYLFIYLGAAVEGLTAAGAALYATAGRSDPRTRQVGGTLISVALVLQALVESVFIGLVALIHHRCVRSGNLPRNVRTLCIMLYGTSSLVLVRCICRAVADFSTLPASRCSAVCRAVLFHEWYLYVFEAAPMVVYTFWVNLHHPGKMLPRHFNHYLDPDGRTERIGPGWIETRSQMALLLDPLDFQGLRRGESSTEAFWLQPNKWPAVKAKKSGREGLASI